MFVEIWFDNCKKIMQIFLTTNALEEQDAKKTP